MTTPTPPISLSDLEAKAKAGDLYFLTHQDECNTYMAWGKGPHRCDCGATDTVLALIAATKQLEETGRWINNGRSVVDRSVHRGGKAVDDINFDIANALLPFQADNREE